MVAEETPLEPSARRNREGLGVMVKQQMQVDTPSMSPDSSSSDVQRERQ